MKKLIWGIVALSLIGTAFSAGMFNAFYFGGGIGFMTLYSTPTPVEHLRIRAPYINVELGNYFRIGSRVYFTTARVMPTMYAGFSVDIFKPNNYFALTAKPYAGVLVEKYFGDPKIYYGGLCGITFSTTRRFMGAFNKMESFLDIAYTYVQNENQEAVVSIGFQLGM